MIHIAFNVMMNLLNWYIFFWWGGYVLDVKFYSLFFSFWLAIYFWGVPNFICLTPLPNDRWSDTIFTWYLIMHTRLHVSLQPSIINIMNPHLSATLILKKSQGLTFDIFMAILLSFCFWPSCPHLSLDLCFYICLKCPFLFCRPRFLVCNDTRWACRESWTRCEDYTVPTTRRRSPFSRSLVRL